MARINTNVSSVIAQAHLSRTQGELSVRLERLSTGLRINRGKDDPAGLIISERLRSDIAGVNQGISNAQRASSVISTTEAALAEVNDLLNSVRGLIVQSANTGAISDEERAANQLQIDSAIESITRISNTASFGGMKLLNGNLDYQLSGVRNSAITNAKINGATFTNGGNIQVDVDVVTSAQMGSLFYSGATTPPGVLLTAMTLEVKGPKGVQVISVGSGSLTDLITAINRTTSSTGITATAINGNVNSGVVFSSATYGTDAFVSVKRLNPPADVANSFSTYKLDNNAAVPGAIPFDWAGLLGSNTLTKSDHDVGQDVKALVNGSLVNGRGLTLNVRLPTLSANITLESSFATRPASAATRFDITGGGALFQLGPNVTVLQQENIGIQSVSASALGGIKTANGVEYLNSLKTGEYNSVDSAVKRNTDFAGAEAILAAAIDQVTELRGRLGAFERSVLATNVNSLQSQFENLTSAVSQIRDADFAVETSLLTRAQILSAAGTSTLQLANQQSQQVLQLLGG